MLSVLGRCGLRILRRTSPASIKGPWTMKFTFSQPRLSTVSCFVFSLFLRVCVHAHTLLCVSLFSVAWHRSYPAGRHPNTTGNDHTLRRLTSLSLSFSISRCVFQRLPLPRPSPLLSPLRIPPPSVRFLLSALISLADIRTGKRQWNVARLDWINTCVECTLLNINYKGLKMSGIHLRR